MPEYIKISELPQAELPLSGNDVLPIVQGEETRQVSALSIAPPLLVIPSLELKLQKACRLWGRVQISETALFWTLNPQFTIYRKRTQKRFSNGTNSHLSDQKEGKVMKWSMLRDIFEINTSNHILFNLQNVERTPNFQEILIVDWKEFADKTIETRVGTSDWRIDYTFGQGKRKREGTANTAEIKGRFGVGIRIENPAYPASRRSLAEDEQSYKGVPRFLYGEVSDFTLAVKIGFDFTNQRATKMVSLKR
jgi:hypothetical protein